MLEKIYTIPVNEAFEASAADHSLGCPFCALFHKLEENELDLILGASMMEPDVRIKTNKRGFCGRHFDMMLTRKNRLGLSLMLESHLNELRGEVDVGALSALMKGAGSAAADRIASLEKSCYVCERIDFSLSKMIENSLYLWEQDRDFRIKLENQPYICLPHFKALIECGKRNLPKKVFADFYKQLSDVVFSYYTELSADVSKFCKKFDYRYDDEPWGNAKDAPDRAIKFLKGDHIH